MPRKAQPVPPVYQPEAAARAIHYAAHHYRREWALGLVTEAVLTGNAVAPGLGDWYLGKTGYGSQMTDEPEDPGRPNNLYAPLPGDYGARGRHVPDALESSEQWWVARNRDWLLAGLGAVALTWLLAPKGDRHAPANGRRQIT
jgi:hypothetical protein